MRSSRGRIAARHLTRTAAVLASMLLGSGFLLSVPAGADSSTGSALLGGNFTISAEGDGLEMTLSDPSLPLIQTISTSPYGASASLDSLGESLADAGAPYSPVIYGLPSLVNGLGSGGTLPALPPLPGYTSSSYPAKPSSAAVLDGYDLTATSGPSDSMGKAVLGDQPPGADNPTMFASAETTTNSDGSVTATATAGADAINFGQLFDIGNLSTTESITVPATGRPVLKSTADLGTITVLGLKNGLTLDGLNVLGVNEPIPLTSSLISIIDSVLAPSGASIAYLPQTFAYTDGTDGTGTAPDPSKTLQGVDSGALQVRFKENVPSQGLVSYTYTLGRTFVSATNMASPGSSGVGSDTTLPPASPGSVGSTPVNPGSSVIGSGGTTSTGSTSADVANSGTGVSAPAPAPVVATPPSNPANSTSDELQHPSAIGKGVPAGGPSNASIYLLLVLGAIVAFAASQLIRLLAVRLTLFAGHGT